MSGTPIDDAGATELAERSRGTPRVANRLLRRARDFAEVEGTGSSIWASRARRARGSRSTPPGSTRWIAACSRIITDTYEGGPVGVETLAAALSEPRDTIEDVYEPYLLQIGMLGRTPRGRIATKKSLSSPRSPAQRAPLRPPLRVRFLRALDCPTIR